MTSKSIMGMFMGMSGSTTQKYWRIRGKAFDGRQVKEQSLKTHDYAEAMARLGRWLQKCKAESTRARAASDIPPTGMAFVSCVELERLKQVRRLSTYRQLKNSPVRAKRQVGQKLTSRARAGRCRCPIRECRELRSAKLIGWTNKPASRKCGALAYDA